MHNGYLYSLPLAAYIVAVITAYSSNMNKPKSNSPAIPNKRMYPERFLISAKPGFPMVCSIASISEIKSAAKMTKNGKHNTPIPIEYNKMLNWKFIALFPWLPTNGFSL